MADVLLVAATDIELGDLPGLACGVGPVEAAAVTARRLASDPPSAVLHVGIAGGHGITPGGLVIGSESVYCDLSAEIPVVDRVRARPAAARERARGGPERSRPADRDERARSVGSPVATCASRAMEGFGVLRACALAGVPAVEIRAISNELGRGRPLALAYRARPRGARGRAPARARSGREVASPRHGAASEARASVRSRRPCRRRSGRSASSSARRSGAYGASLLAGRSSLGIPVVAANALVWQRSSRRRRARRAPGDRPADLAELRAARWRS